MREYNHYVIPTQSLYNIFFYSRLTHSKLGLGKQSLCLGLRPFGCMIEGGKG